MPPLTVRTWRGNLASWVGRLAPPLCTCLGVLLLSHSPRKVFSSLRGRAPSSPAFKHMYSLFCTTACLGKSIQGLVHLVNMRLLALPPGADSGHSVCATESRFRSKDGKSHDCDISPSDGFKKPSCFD
uniref:Uncharacterized protein n=1 Tax=Molossus molossus TaxID=27622 RepID=A0A7J8C8U1_MOLMO|nr:hypothetical protein HJG59_009919 [Molossus molossus]